MAFKTHVLDKQDLDFLANDTDSELSSLHLFSSESSSLEDLLEVGYLCKQCQVPLCVTKCFELYNTKINF